MALPYTSILAGASGQSSGYSISNSARFVSGNSAYLSRTPGAVGTSRRIFTISTWMKLSDVSTYQGEILHVGSASGTSNTDWLQFYYDANKFKVGGWSSEYLATTAVYRDPGAWLHVVLAVDTTQATAANRMRLYVNGSEVTAFTTASYPTLNQDTPVNNTQQHNIGARTGGSVFYNGYLSNYYLIDGQQLTPSSFGQTNTSGVWVPKAYSGTYGTNGFLMEFKNSAALGTDTSGNANTFTSSGLVAGDQFSDTPTLNCPTLNPLYKFTSATGSRALSNGNTKTTYTGSGGGAAVDSATIAIPASGKWYWEVAIDFTSDTNSWDWSGIVLASYVGPTTPSAPTDGGYGYTNYDGSVNSSSSGSKTNGATRTTYGSGFWTGNVLGIAYDADNHEMYFAKDNTWMASSNPATRTSPALTSIPSGAYLPVRWCNPGSGAAYAQTYNFGGKGFTYTPPTGFNALNTTNLPAPAIKDGSAHFQTALHTGTGSAITINQSGNSTFTSDFVWTKGRSGATDHILSNIISGTGKYLVSNTTAAEVTNAQALTAFGAGSISYGTLAAANTNAATYVDWMWKGGGAGVSNTSGSITSTVSANTTAGISIVKWTGTAANATVGHGLGSVPTFMILKPNAVTEWPVYHGSLANTEYVVLNTTAAKATGATYWNSTSPTSTVFSLGSSTNTNNSSGMVALVCAPIAGFSAISAYTGNGSADGPFIYTGFKPAWVLIKRTDSAGSEWNIMDSSRPTYNPEQFLFADTSGAETTTYAFDILSNGFKWRQATYNASGGTYVYAAFASNPFGGSGAAPATAR